MGEEIKNKANEAIEDHPYIAGMVAAVVYTAATVGLGMAMVKWSNKNLARELGKVFKH